jgi:uncharacterized transporter YbjL
MIFLDRPSSGLVTNQAATALNTNLVAAALLAPANFLRLGQVWRATAWFTFLHTAAATPTLTAELAVAGSAVISFALTPIATAATYHGKAECVFTVRSAGAAGSLMAAVTICPLGGATQAADQGGAQVDIAPDTIDTTQARLIEFRLRMTTGVAGNTLTVSQGYFEKVCG